MAAAFVGVLGALVGVLLPTIAAVGDLDRDLLGDFDTPGDLDLDFEALESSPTAAVDGDLDRDFDFDGAGDLVGVLVLALGRVFTGEGFLGATGGAAGLVLRILSDRRRWWATQSRASSLIFSTGGSFEPAVVLPLGLPRGRLGGDGAWWGSSRASAAGISSSRRLASSCNVIGVGLVGKGMVLNF